MTTSPAGLLTRDSALATLRCDRLAQAAQTYAPSAEFHDDYLWEKLCAAETSLERRLRTFLSPVDILPQGYTETPPPSGRWIEEPGYDYSPDLFSGDRWGLIETRQKPIISVTRIWFAYPSPGLGSNFIVPNDWLRIDKKYGRINLVATSSIMTMPLNTFILSVLGAGRMVPLMLQIRYRAGLQDATTAYPDLLDLIKKMAVQSLLEDWFLPSSGSISADGLSQSLSVDLAKYQDGVNQRIDALMQAIHGQRLVVC